MIVRQGLSMYVLEAACVLWSTAYTFTHASAKLEATRCSWLLTAALAHALMRQESMGRALLVHHCLKARSYAFTFF